MLIFLFLSMPLVSSVKNRYELPRSLLVGGQCLDEVIFCLEPFDFNDFSLKLTKSLMFSDSYFCEKIGIELPQKTKALLLQHQSSTCIA